LKRSPAQVYSLVIGLSLTLAGIVGFLYSSDFSTGSAASDPGNRDAVLGVLDVNGWHNVVHLLTGLLGLAVAGSYDSARRFAAGLGFVYAIVVILGLLYGTDDAIFGLIPINAEDNVLHGLIALAGLAAWAASPSAPRPTVGSPSAVSRL
jgi:hypothetical protein